MRVFTQQILIVTAGLLSCALMTVISLQFLSHDISQSQRYHADNTLSLTQSVFYSTIQSLDDLANLNIDDCSPASLLKMRQTVFLSDYIKDAGLVQNNHLACTTTGGELEVPLELDPPSYTTNLDFDVWLNQQLIIFDHLHSGMVIRKGDFTVVIANNTFSSLEYGDNQWEVVNRVDEHYTHLIGTPGTFRRAELDEMEEVDDNYHYFHRCSQTYDFCIALSLYNFTLIKSKFGFLIFSLLFSAAFGILISISSDTLIKRHGSMGSRVRRGINKGHFVCHVQPLVDLQSKRIIGGEVLTRFEDQHGKLMPDEFIPEIRKLRLTWPFTLMIIKDALSQLQASGAITSDTKVSFNIFPCDVENNNIADLQALPEVQQFKGGITLEITEDLQLDSLVANQHINHIIQQGFEVAIDDFGTGYSNLKQLKNFRCQYLKIDKSFVFDLEAGSIRSSLVPHMVEIAKKSDLKVIAEGVENLMQCKVLEDLDVEFGQGWMFGKPMPISQFVEKYTQSNGSTD
ncbi:EAL domain-containing protein [Agarivorans sp. 1_MG-2023]|uniref:EAL domain-containing protein n=1 Tax=Agarivorans sp. 1_MG-2023 TaxID=3062634 RepID=UPI0026E2C11A|nr:EAL domain-containing protein [Agarivorans sp. 1_MG-2023]MDO6764168.1 EAL domain-containing protein [Agarivorans sp. 1_MG-2023]